MGSDCVKEGEEQPQDGVRLVEALRMIGQGCGVKSQPKDGTKLLRSCKLMETRIEEGISKEITTRHGSIGLGEGRSETRGRRGVQT